MEPVWDDNSTVSYSSNQSFTLKCEIWDLIFNVKKEDTQAVAVGPITGVEIDGPTDLDADEEGDFTAKVTPSHRETYYIDFDWWVMYIDDKKEKRENGLKLPPTGQWIKLDQWDGYQTIKFSSAYYDFRLKVRVSDEAYNYAFEDTIDVEVH